MFLLRTNQFSLYQRHTESRKANSLKVPGLTSYSVHALLRRCLGRPQEEERSQASRCLRTPFMLSYLQRSFHWTVDISKVERHPASRYRGGFKRKRTGQKQQGLDFCHVRVVCFFTFACCCLSRSLVFVWAVLRFCFWAVLFVEATSGSKL